MRLIYIDNNSGYIWGDTADIGGRCFSLSGDEADCAIEGARAMDADIGGPCRDYDFSRSAPRDTSDGYHVWRADVGGSEAVPVAADGQDQETIEAVERDCEYLGFVSFSESE